MNNQIIGRRTIGLALALALTMAFQSVASADDPAIEIAADSVCQTALSELFSAPDKATFDRQADQYAKLRGGDDALRISQLLRFAAQEKQDARTKVFVGRVLARLDASKEVIVAALVPQLNNRDEAVRALVKESLAGYEDRSASRPPDFSAYRAIMEADVRAGREPQTSLVYFMYESDPGTALQTLIRAFQLRDPDEIKPILWSEHVIAELLWKRRFGFVEPKAVDPAVVREIEKLSQHPRWWVRLYAAEIVENYPELGAATVVKGLSEDADRRVRDHFQRAKVEGQTREMRRP